MDVSVIFTDSFWMIASLITSVVSTLMTGVVNQFFSVKGTWVKRLISWLVAAGLSVLAWGIGVVSFAQPVWIGIVALCLVTGLSSNGIYSIDEIQATIKNWFPKRNK